MEFPTHLKPSKSLSGRSDGSLDDLSLSTAEESDELSSVEEAMTGLRKVSSRLRELTVLATRDGKTTLTTKSWEESDSSFCSIDDLDQRLEVMYSDYNDIQSQGDTEDSVATFTDFTFDETGSFCAPPTNVKQAVLPQLLPGLLNKSNGDEDDDSDDEERVVADALAAGDASLALRVVRRKALERSASPRTGPASSRRDPFRRGITSSSRRDLLVQQTAASHENLMTKATAATPGSSSSSRRDLLTRGTASRRDLLTKEIASYDENLTVEAGDDDTAGVPALSSSRRDLLSRATCFSRRELLINKQSTSSKNLLEGSGHGSSTTSTEHSLLTRSASTAWRTNSRRSLLTRSASSVKRIQAV